MGHLLTRQERDSQSDKQGRIKVVKYHWCLQLCDSVQIRSLECAVYSSQVCLGNRAGCRTDVVLWMLMEPSRAQLLAPHCYFRHWSIAGLTDFTTSRPSVVILIGSGWSAYQKHVYQGLGPLLSFMGSLCLYLIP